MRPRSSSKGKQRSHEEWLSLIAQHEQSHKTIRSFCYQQGLDEQYFSKKRRQLGYPPTRIQPKAKATVNVSSFIPVKVDSSVAPTAQLELVFHSTHLSIPSTLSPQWLSTLMRGLS